MKLKNFVEGLEILKSYFEDQDGYHIGAEHDIFYVYATDTPLPETAIKKLLELGWFQEEMEAADNGEFDTSSYDPEKGWAAFT
jgi:hypothetical protein